MRRAVLFLVLLAALIPAAVAAQGAATAATPAPLEPEEEKSILVEGELLYKHIADRDPFSPLITAKSGKGGQYKTVFKTTGVGRYTTESCNLSAIVKTPGGEVAYFATPDGKCYKVTVGEEFADGKVTSISYELGRVVIQQELINDPTHVKPFRDLVLVVRSQGGESK